MVELPVGGLQTTGDRFWRYSGASCLLGRLDLWRGWCLNGEVSGK